VAAPLFTHYDPVSDIEYYNVKQAPGGDHLLGTDHIGRDVWSRLLYGGRTSVLTGVLVALFAGAIGVTIGLVAGYYGGTVDALLMRFTDIMLSFPFLILAIAIMAALGSSQRNIIISLAVTSWPGFARLTRSHVLAIKNSEYIEAAKVADFTNPRILFRHVLPNCMGTIIIQLTLTIGGAILSAAGLAYLGMSPNVAKPEWGAMLNDGKPYLRTNPYLTTIPGIAISITVLAINWIGDGLRDAFDPKMRK
jgi:peptide/nickel transport system permease protein